MPDEYQTHSSFNTLDKQNKVERSHSPEAAAPTSFGASGTRGSQDRLVDQQRSAAYQMPPDSDGTML